MEGWLQKRTAGLFRVSKRRYFRLIGSTLTSARDAEGSPTCTIPLGGANVSRADGTTHGVLVTLPSRATLCLSAATEPEAAKWYAALVAASTRATTGAAAAPGDDPSLPPLPEVLEIEGTPETGTELRLSCPEPGVLEALCIAWFRFSDPAAAPALDADVSNAPHTRFIAGATAQLYTCSRDDVGKRLGVVVKAAGGRSTRWVLMPDPVAQLSATTLEVRVRVEPHQHTKYCDRRVRVCTAAGRYREGATLRADITGLPPGQEAHYGVVWYRSTAVDPRLLRRQRQLQQQQQQRKPGLADAGAEVAAVPPTPPPAARPAELRTPAPSSSGGSSGGGGGGSESILQQAWNLITGSGSRGQTPLRRTDGAAADGGTPGALPARATGIRHVGSVNDGVASVAALAGLTYSRVPPRSSALLPPAPPDHVPATPLPELKVRLAELADVAADHAAAAERPHELPRPRPLPLPGAPLGELEYALFSEDVGRLVCCALVPLDPSVPVPHCIQPHGAAPPQPLLTLRAPPGVASVDVPPRLGGAPAAASDTGVGDVDESWADTPPSPVKRRSGGATAFPVAPPAPVDAPPAGLDPVPIPAGVHVSVSVGPVEAAPPRAREVWIDGVPAVGCLLTGHVYYYGGTEGASEACWVAITDNGDTVELKKPTLCDPTTPLPDLDAEIGSAADMHPRALRLTEDLVGHLIKFKLKPARADGDVGHMESSRPTPEVAAASAEAVAAARAMAAAKRRAAAAARVAGGSASPFSS